MSLPGKIRKLAPGLWQTWTFGSAPEDNTFRMLVLVHGLLTIFGVYFILSASSGTYGAPSLIIFTLAGASHGLVYILPEGSISKRRYQRLFILVGVTITTGWLLPLCLGAEPGMWIVVALVLVAPLISEDIVVWIACTAGSMALALAGPRLGWLGPENVHWETEFLVVELSMIAWITFATLFDNLELTALLRTQLGHERTQTRVVSRIASSFLAAKDIHEVFRGFSQALSDSLGVERCLMVRADPLRTAGSLVAMSGNWDSDSAGVDLSEDSPVRAGLISGKVLYVHDRSPDDAHDALVVTANSGLGVPLVIYCEAKRNRMTPATLALVEEVADAAVKTIRNVEFLGETREKAQTDPLTELSNRRSFQSNLKREFQRAQRHERPLSLLMIDLDFLKAINDEHGHPVGDSVIRTTAEQIVIASRGTDYLAARYGGEEFAVILPETDLEGAVAAAERICEAIAEKELPTVGHFTASIGAACFPVNATTELDLIETADAALYDAKRAGRNQVAASITHTLV